MSKLNMCHIGGQKSAPHVCPPANAGPALQHRPLGHSETVSSEGVVYMCTGLSSAECIACGVTWGESGVCAKLVMQYSTKHGQDVQGGGGQSGAAPAGPFTDLPLFCGAQKRAFSAFAQQVHTLKQLHQLMLLGSPKHYLAFNSLRKAQFFLFFQLICLSTD